MRADQQHGVRLLWLRMGGIAGPGVWDLEVATEYEGVRVTGVEDCEQLVFAVEAETEVVLDSGDEALATAAMWAAAARRHDRDPRELHGSFGCDPLAWLIDHGKLQGSLDGALRQLTELAAWSLEKTPGMRSALVDLSPITTPEPIRSRSWLLQSRPACVTCVE